MRLRDKVAIITGAASGLGAAQARLFAAHGARVVATDIQDDALDDVVRGIVSDGGCAIPAHHDVTSEADWARVVTTTVDRLGCLDVLVNNAGVYAPKNVEETSLQEWNAILAVNATGPFLGLKHVVPVLRDHGGGSIVNISSIAGLVGQAGAAYAASKAAVRLLTKNAAVDYAKDHIRINSVHPGTILTPINEEGMADPGARAFVEQATPLPPHIGKPDDVAYAVLYLASPEAAFVTGSELVVDGGWTAK
ncbi:cyclopentanol dehydrogenase [Streptomyces noursei]|nr:cyclopentanol dehydrogenase [Streptomyces noursei]